MQLQYIRALLMVLTLGTVTTFAQTEPRDCANPQSPTILALVKQGLELEANRDVEGAIEASKKVLAIEPMNECALNTIAGLYGLMGNFQQETLWARRAIEANPKFVKAYINLGSAQGSLGNLKEAEASFNKARELEPKNPLPIYSLGVLAEQQQRFQQALTFYQQSVEADPKFQDGYFNLAAMYADLKRFADAKATLKKLLQLNPNAQDAKEMLRQLERQKR
jgi:tetratricopeptide (TPR) repeat protein